MKNEKIFTHKNIYHLSTPSPKIIDILRKKKNQNMFGFITNVLIILF